MLLTVFMTFTHARSQYYCLDSHMKGAGMLVVSLRGEGVLGKKNIFSHEGLERFPFVWKNRSFWWDNNGTVLATGNFSEKKE